MSEFMPKIALGAALGVACLTGCSSSETPPEAFYSESTVQSPLYTVLTNESDTKKPQDADPLGAEQSDGQDDDKSIIGTSMWGELSPLANGMTRVSMYENSDFTLDEEASFAIIESDCHSGREPQVGVINHKNSGLEYSISCKRDGVPDNRPNVLKNNIDVSQSYENMMPTKPNESVTVVAYHGDLTFQHVPQGDRTIIKLGNPTDFEIAQIHIAK